MARDSQSNRRGANRGKDDKLHKKKACAFCREEAKTGVKAIDYKDVNLLTRFVSDRSKIRNRRVTGNDVQQQREIANAIKNSREMALLPYSKRVAQTRTRGPRDGEGRRERAEDQVRDNQVEETTIDDELDGVEGVAAVAGEEA